MCERKSLLPDDPALHIGQVELVCFYIVPFLYLFQPHDHVGALHLLLFSLQHLRSQE